MECTFTFPKVYSMFMCIYMCTYLRSVVSSLGFWLEKSFKSIHAHVNMCDNILTGFELISDEAQKWKEFYNASPKTNMLN